MPGFVGIAGSLPRGTTDIDARVDAMKDAVCHFDDYIVRRHTFDQNRVVFDHVSLPLSDFPVQEHRDDRNGVTVVVDGELANGRELCSDLGLQRGANAAQIICRLYDRDRKLAFLKRLNGWFNVIICDGPDKQMVVANDRHGIRPMYYCCSGGEMIFAGEVKGILAALSGKAELDEPGIADYFVFDGPLNDRTFFRGVSRMSPASAWVFRGGEWQKRSYWSYRDYGTLEKYSEGEAHEKARDLFPAVVRRYLKGDYLFSLTGGNDTRMIASLLEPDGMPRSCFTYGISRNTADVILAKKVAGALGLKHEFIPVSGVFLDKFASCAEKAIWLSDGMGDVMSSSILHVHAGHRNSIVAGGKYGTQVARGVRQKVWELSGLPNMEVFSRDFLERVNDLPRQSLAEARGRFSEFGHKEDASLAFTIVEECRHHWGGKLAMENALIAVRTPFTDNDMIDFTLRLPIEMTTNAGLQHSVIREYSRALARIPTNRGLLPLRGSLAAAAWAKVFKAWFFLTTVCNSRRVPPVLGLDETFLANNATSKYRCWFRGKLKDYVREIVLDPRTFSREIFDTEKLKMIVDRHISRKGDYSSEINKVISFELFLRQFVDQAPGRGQPFRVSR